MMSDEWGNEHRERHRRHSGSKTLRRKALRLDNLTIPSLKVGPPQSACSVFFLRKWFFKFERQHHVVPVAVSCDLVCKIHTCLIFWRPSLSIHLPFSCRSNPDMINKHFVGTRIHSSLVIHSCTEIFPTSKLHKNPLGYHTQGWPSALNRTQFRRFNR